MHAAAKAGNEDILKLLMESGGNKSLKAAQKDLGKNLMVEDCTANHGILNILSSYSLHL